MLLAHLHLDLNQSHYQHRLRVKHLFEHEFHLHLGLNQNHHR